MCGIAGFVDQNISEDHAYNVLKEMSRTLKHRGPDGSGQFFSNRLSVGLGHTRLSIIDLTETGAQPMVSTSGRFKIVYNGEIYNHEDLRERTSDAGYAFRGTSDTEVVLAAIEVWGLESALQMFVGMFAFALLDQERRVLHLVRDRLGEKPVYFGWQGDTFLFASELKALKIHPKWKGTLNTSAIYDLISLGYIPCGSSIYSQIEKLPPASRLSLDLTSRDKKHVVSRWWSLSKNLDQSGEGHFCGTESEAVASVIDQLRSTIRDQLVSDVPVGALLSGGIDSSIVTAIAQEQSARKIETFTIGFNEKTFDESHHAKQIASHLGTEHHEWIVTPGEALSVIPDIPKYFDEPFADSSQVPTFLVFQLASKKTKVVLSGDGGDEVFGGYNRHYLGPEIFTKLSHVSTWMRKMAHSSLRSIPVKTWQRLLTTGLGNRVFPGTLSVSVEKLAKLIRLLPSTTRNEFYQSLVREGDVSVLRDVDCREENKASYILEDQAIHFAEEMMRVDMLTYLPGDILVKVDRAAMANSVESRAPFLDHRLIALAACLPINLKIREGEGKVILKEALNRFIPKTMTQRPKSGFAIPIDDWLRGSLRDWCYDLLAPKSIAEAGIFHSDRVKSLLESHISGRKENGLTLWRLLMFQSWLQEQR